ncbi:MAG: hypothetical protein QOF81_950 [Acidimicrobiaceae bacterium]|jgi:hypothetical protein|nr:hypothetical protein [Acidimicrobiaceae bacterium]
MTSPDRPEIPTSTGAMLERTRRRAEQMRRRRRAALAAVAAVVAVGLPLVLIDTRHSGRVLRTVGEPTSVAPATSAKTEPTPSTARPQPALPSTSRPSVDTTTITTTASSAVKDCSSGQLKASLMNPNGAAGSVGYDLVLRNTGSVTCSLRGYPGVSYVTGATGATVGAPAQRDNLGTINTITLSPGHAARATLIEVNSLNYPPDTCRLTQVGGLRIYPPNQTVALFVPQTARACANPADAILSIGPLEAFPGG